LPLLISPQQALDLELKLNRTSNGREWMSLGDILFKWRLSSTGTIQPIKTFDVTREQMDWIKANIDDTKRDKKEYTLQLKEELKKP
jgi:hypothetical protein